MTTKSPDTVHIVLRIAKPTVDMIDSVAQATNRSRSSWIRQSLQRCLSYAMDHEIPVLQQPDVQAVLNPSGEPR